MLTVAQFHNIFCSSAAPLPTSDIAEWLKNAWLGEGVPRFAPAPGANPAWDRFEAQVPGIGRPFVFLHETAPADFAVFVDEAISEPPTALRPETVTRLRATRQVIGIEFAPDLLDDDAWEMLDIVQAFIAREYDGLLFTPDGVYDAQLQPTS